MKKFISVMLCFTLLFSVCSSSVCANGDSADFEVTVSDSLDSINADVPVVFVNGMQGEFYKGLSTETEEDDVRIWGPDTDVILEAVKKYAFSLTFNLLIGNYDKVTEIAGDTADVIFGDFVCDKNGKPNPDTGKKDKSNYTLQSENGYDNSYGFVYDWRLDMVTIAGQLDEYVNDIMELTGSDKVAFVAMSMGNAVMTTYLYEYYYTSEDYEERNHIDSVVFLAGAMNGVATCEDPFSGNMGVDSTSILRMMSELMRDNDDTKVIYTFVEILYSLGMLDPITDYVNNLNGHLTENGLNDAVLTNIAQIPGFLALMSLEHYEEARAFLFDTPEKQAEYAEIIRMSDYYHYNVQKNSVEMIQSLMDDEINVAVIAEYGCTIIPITSDNDRMSDGTILTASESFGATCAEVDGTLGENYVQAEACECGKSHISADNQIDASTCAFPDVTWFCKNLRHSEEGKYVADLIDVIIYSDEQVTVWDYSQYPQYLINLDDNCLVPLTTENAGEILPYEETTVFSEIKKKFSFNK